MDESVGMSNSERFKILATVFRQYNLAQRQNLIDKEATNNYYYNGTIDYYGYGTSYTWSTASYSCYYTTST